MAKTGLIELLDLLGLGPKGGLLGDPYFEERKAAAEKAQEDLRRLMTGSAAQAGATWRQQAGLFKPAEEQMRRMYGTEPGLAGTMTPAWETPAYVPTTAAEIEAAAPRETKTQKVLRYAGEVPLLKISPAYRVIKEIFG